MQDVFVAPQGLPKNRRVCANPVCGKALSSLNKQAVCFGCHDRAQMERFADPAQRTGISNAWRWKQP